MAKISKPLGQSISNFLLSILPDSSLGFLGSAYISLVLDNRHSQFENVLYETRINIMRVLKITTIGNIHGAFSRLFFINSLYELL